jgi:signal transduction histidine kinase
MNIGGLTVSTLITIAGALLAGVLLGVAGMMLAARRQANKPEKLGELKARQDLFINIASHYLLTPLSIVQTALAALQEGDVRLDGEQRRKLYGSVEMGTKRLWIVTEQLVLVNDIDRNTLVLQLRPSMIAEVMQTAVSDVDIFARAKSVRIDFRDETTRFQEAKIDARRMRQAIIAVLDNAVKFSNPGAVVTARLMHDEANYIIEVHDDGVGMAPDVMKHLSERFYRGSSLYDFNYEGMGLGLHIAHAIVQLHNGEIAFTSAPNQGTTVVARVPIL